MQTSKREYPPNQRPANTVRFISPYPLDDCIYRVNRLSERRTIPFVPYIRVKMVRIDDENYRFRLRETGPATIEIHGYLRFWTDRLTAVQADVRVHPVTYLEFALFGIGIVLLSVFMLWWIAPLFLPMLLWFVIRYHRGLRYEQNRLARLLEDTLGDSLNPS